MAQQKKLIWTKRAQKERKEILDYWIREHNSTAYSNKLNKLIVETTELIKIHPEIGRKTDINNSIRVKFIKDYEIFYKKGKDSIHILSIWDTRRNPDDLKV